MTTTPSQEDYIEAIWLLIKNKGYARVTDIADYLGINDASVSKMIQKLDDGGFLIYERYRGLNLTPVGYHLGNMLFERHQKLEAFLNCLGMENAQEVHQIVEGIEHHFSSGALDRIENLTAYIQLYPEWWKNFIDWTKKNET